MVNNMISPKKVNIDIISQQHLKAMFLDLITQPKSKYGRGTDLHKKTHCRKIIGLHLLSSTGLRVSNLLEFKKQNLIDLKEKRATIINLIKKRGDYKFNIVISRKDWYWAFGEAGYLKEAYGCWMSILEDNDPVFIGLKGGKKKMLSKDQLRHELNNILKEYGEKKGYKWTTHSFRLTKITNMLNEGVSPNEVQQIMGHERVETTMLYNREKNQEKLGIKRMQGIMDKLDEYDRKPKMSQTYRRKKS